AAPTERRGQNRLAAPVAIGIAGVEEGDAQVEGAPQQVGRLVVGEVAPPAGSDGPDAEADLAEGDVGSSQFSISHQGAPRVGPTPASGPRPLLTSTGPRRSRAMRWPFGYAGS